MNEIDFGNIEQQLGIALPDSYKAVMLARFTELKSSGGFDDDLSCVFLDPERIIHYNLGEREPDAGTADAFPKWWKTFLMFGTNGAGD